MQETVEDKTPVQVELVEASSIMREPALTVVLMAFNESATVAGVVEDLHAQLSSLNQPYEIIAVDDGSTDGTAEALEELAVSGRVTQLVAFGQNRGLGYVYRKGFERATGRFISFFPADGQFPAHAILQLWRARQDNDFVLGYVCNTGRPILSRVLSSCERLLYRALFGSLPRCQGLVLLRRTIVQSLPLVSQGRGWVVVYELLIRAHRAGTRIESVETDSRPRQNGYSKVHNLSVIIDNLRQIGSLWFRMRQAARGNSHPPKVSRVCSDAEGRRDE